MEVRRKEARRWGSCLLSLMCTLVLVGGLFGCAPGNQQEAQPESQAVQDKGAQSEGSSDAKDDQSAGQQGEQSAKKDGAQTPSAPVDEALLQSWEADFKRLADESGMEVEVCAIDLASGGTVAHRSDQKILSASMIKLLIGEAFLGQVSEGKQALDDTYVLKEGDIVGGTGSLGARGAGASVTKRELVQKMIAESDNVATNVLIDLCGMDAVNAEAKRLGLKCTELGRHMMDTEAAANGYDNYTCADDIAVLLKMVYDKTYVNEEMSAFMLECLEAQIDNDCISTGLPAGTVFAHKTGSLATVRHDGGIVEGEKPFVIVTLCGGEGFNEQGAQGIMGQIGEAAYRDMYGKEGTGLSAVA